MIPITLVIDLIAMTMFMIGAVLEECGMMPKSKSTAEGTRRAYTVVIIFIALNITALWSAR